MPVWLVDFLQTVLEEHLSLNSIQSNRTKTSGTCISNWSKSYSTESEWVQMKSTAAKIQVQELLTVWWMDGKAFLNNFWVSSFIKNPSGDEPTSSVQHILLHKGLFGLYRSLTLGVDRYVFFRADTDTDYYRSSRPITDILNRYTCLV